MKSSGSRFICDSAIVVTGAFVSLEARAQPSERASDASKEESCIIDPMSDLQSLREEGSLPAVHVIGEAAEHGVASHRTSQ